VKQKNHRYRKTNIDLIHRCPFLELKFLVDMSARGKRRISDSQDSHRIPEILTEFPGFPMDSQGILGVLKGIHWESLESHGTPWNPMELPGIRNPLFSPCFPHISKLYSMKLNSKISQTKVQHVLCHTALYPCWVLFMFLICF
jgi:hypothetical protein